MNPTAAANFLQRFAIPPLRASTILIGFVVPISVALDNVLLVLLGMLFMVQDTGYAILLLSWLAWTTLARHAAKLNKPWCWRQAATVSLVCETLAVSAYHAPPRLHGRVTLMQIKYQAWQEGKSGKDSSIGQRLNFYHNTLQIVQHHPVPGVDTGGFPVALAQQTQDKDVTQTHNEYLMITVQTGAIGLAFLLYLFYTQWRYAPLLNTPFEQGAASQSPPTMDMQLKEVFSHFPKIALAILFGSVALNRQRADNNSDIAAVAKQAMTVHERIILVGALAGRTGRTVGLNVVSEPLLEQIVRHCRKILGRDTLRTASYFVHDGPIGNLS